jgi:hypothetical protein
MSDAHGPLYLLRFSVDLSLQVVQVSYVPQQEASQAQVTCTATVLESLHCMIGPGFMDNC